MASKADQTRSLTRIQDSASTARILNLHYVKQKHGAESAYRGKPLFQNKRLNECFIVKHTLRQNERENLRAQRHTATKIIFPLCSDDLKLGGYSLFVEQPDFDSALKQALGEIKAEKLEQDLETMREIARLPSFDPYLLRERLRLIGRDVAPCYFEISEADLQRVQALAVAELSRLVELAYRVEGPETEVMSTKLAKLIMADQNDEALEPLRQVLRLSKEEYSHGMFGWKGFLYYKWMVKRLLSRFDAIVDEIDHLNFSGASPADLTPLEAKRSKTVRYLRMRMKQVQGSLGAYDAAYDNLIDHDEPRAFRTFLLKASSMFISLGEHVASINHVCSSWSFQFGPEDPRMLSIVDANDLFEEFISSLGVEDERMAA